MIEPKQLRVVRRGRAESEHIKKMFIQQLL